MKVRNDYSADITVGGATLAPGMIGDADLSQDDPFVKAGWLSVVEEQKQAPKPQTKRSRKPKPEQAESDESQ